MTKLFLSLPIGVVLCVALAKMGVVAAAISGSLV